jgi:hypothetical protein
MKFYNKTTTRTTKTKCVICAKKLTTTDILYTKDMSKCWECDRKGNKTLIEEWEIQHYF